MKFSLVDTCRKFDVFIVFEVKGPNSLSCDNFIESVSCSDLYLEKSDGKFMSTVSTVSCRFPKGF